MPRARLFRVALLSAVVLVVAALQAQQVQAPRPIPAPQGTRTENGLSGYAKILCSGVFVSGRAPEDEARCRARAVSSPSHCHAVRDGR